MSRSRSERTGRGVPEAAVAYTLAVVACLLLLVWVLQLWRADMRIPLQDSGDAMFSSLDTKSIVDTGWYLDNPHLGMPGGMHLQDFPATENLPFVMLKAISLVTPSWGLVLNLFYLLTYPLAVVAFIVAARRLDISYPSAAVCGLLYAFLPYHFYRGEGHLSLAAYFTVPLLLPILWWLLSKTPPFYARREGEGGGTRLTFGKREAFSVVAALMLASSMVYYPFFASLFILLAGGISALRHRSIRHAVAAAALAATIAVGVLANLAPGIAYRLRYGPNSAVATRDLGESERSPLKLSLMLLPVTGHRLAPLARIKQIADTSFDLVNENKFATLGVFGSACLLWLLLLRLVGSSRLKPFSPTRAAALDDLSVLSLAGILVGMVGGFGPLFAQFVSAQIRAYNRISIFVALFVFAALAILLDHLADRLRGRGRSFLISVIAVALVVVGVYDLASRDFVPDYAGIARRFRSDERFVHSIQSVEPRGAMVFELPYLPFPEAGIMFVNLPPYELLRGYLHSDSLRWSYGAMHGRATDIWQRTVTSEPTATMVGDIAKAGFGGIYIDRRGYQDRAAALEKQLTALLGPPRVVSDDGERSFFLIRR